MSKIGYQKILDLIPPHSRVLDIGCGNGELLEQIIQTRQATGYGIELDIENVLSCIQRGISVFHGDADEGLLGFSNQSYDVVILSHTLQQVKNPLYVISEMLRVGKIGIVSFPNIAHWRARLHLFLGKPPKTEALPYDWYDTPNIRVVSIHGFRQLCRDHGFKIQKEIPLYHAAWAEKLIPTGLSNLCCEKGLFVLEKGTL